MVSQIQRTVFEKAVINSAFIVEGAKKKRTRNKPLNYTIVIVSESCSNSRFSGNELHWAEMWKEGNSKEFVITGKSNRMGAKKQVLKGVYFWERRTSLESSEEEKPVERESLKTHVYKERNNRWTRVQKEIQERGI